MPYSLTVSWMHVIYLMSELVWDEISSSLWKLRHTVFLLLSKNCRSIVLPRPRGSGNCLRLLKKLELLLFIMDSLKQLLSEF